MKATPSSSHWICNSCRATPRRTYRPAFKHSAFGLTRKSSTTSTALYNGTPIHTRGVLPDSPARTRFAPSPTGNLHLGSIRTALYNYLLAKATKGQFLLRIEDTDAKRTIPGAEDRLYEDLRWAGLQWDEGPLVGGSYGPYRQSERLGIYKSHIQRLLDAEFAYRCFCTPERIDELNRRRHEKGLLLGYDRKCTHLSKAEAAEKAHAGEAHVVRFLSPSVWPRYYDWVFGKSGHGLHRGMRLLVDEPVYEDTILIKSDGYPTYHWANICDDHDMQITHVVRGSEWMTSTSLHVALHRSLGWIPPTYAHVPLLTSEQGQKLSKRTQDTDVATFRANGYSPEALINFAALLGWSHQEKKDFMDLQRLTELFDMKITRGNVKVSFKKLKHLQVHYARRHIEAGDDIFQQIVGDVALALVNKYGAQRILTFTGDRQLRDVVASMLRLRFLTYDTPADYADNLCILFKDPPEVMPDFPIAPEHIHLVHYLQIAATALTLVPKEQWTDSVHHANLTELETRPDHTISTTDWKKLLYQYLRWAVLGQKDGPAVSQCMEILGRETCLARIQQANTKLREMELREAQPVLEQQGWKGDVDGKRRAEKDYNWTSYALQQDKENRR
ncbi:glutamyl-tRNA synthetase [Exophiala aquamarina CBS 119918]|uniref:Glutamate--tRNA ligase, mitochondrial n=1 Tax=Exophiala aquamarina CBS 119918 TaxID=1182545 RepID=A0A072PLG0_9EURO|nr:glutamyl-tRNA synthetase [Exophiala aquamarina CBS 119918]KEF60924.1 glutamyl-tRNA synthetase [Exophiala aquamarina CBS 119918]